MTLADAADRLEQLRAPVESGAPYAPAIRDRAVPAPKGWQAGVEFVSPTEHIVTTGPIPGDLVDESGWAALIATMQGPLPDGWVIELQNAAYDPVAWTRDVAYEVDGKSKTPAVTRAVWRYRFRTRFDPKAATHADVDAMIAEMSARAPGTAVRRPVMGATAFGVLLTDWQIGKVDGDGLKGTEARVAAMIDDVEVRIGELRAAGRDVDELFVFLGGDMVEGCDGFYPQQTFGVEVDRREQVKIARRLFRNALVRWAPLVARVVVTGVGGNHGENRKDGKSFTTFGDNDDVAIIEQVAEVLADRPEFEHVEFIIPTDHLAITVRMAGHIVGLTHGHVAGAGVGAEAKIRRWYEGQAGGKLPIGDADLLLTGHYHSFQCSDWGGCLWLQGPTLDGGSRWFTDQTGRYGRHGTLTFTMHPEAFLRDLAIL